MYIFFWIIFTLILTHYFIWPALLYILATTLGTSPLKNFTGKKISLIIAAYNEEKVIREKLENSLALDYPRNLLEIIVVSDGSTDQTANIVRSFASEGVIGLHKSERQGKSAALNRGVAMAKGEIIVFSDANSMYEKEALINLIRNFHDPEVGGVSGRKSVKLTKNRAASQGDSLFWSVESRIKSWQSLLGSIPTTDGEIFAMRKSLFRELPRQIINDDTMMTFDIIKAGYRVIYENEAVSQEEASLTLLDDFNVKARMVSGGYQMILPLFGKILAKNPIFVLQFFMHKIMRHLMPFLLIALYLSNLYLGGKFYLAFLGLQTVFYIFAATGYFMEKMKIRPSIFYFPLYYCMVNGAALTGAIYFFNKRSLVSTWKKAAR